MRIISIVFLLITSAVQGQTLKLELVKTFIGHQHGVNRVAFSPDKKMFASGDTRGGVRVWNLEKETVQFSWNEHYGSILDLRFSSDNSMLVTSGSDGHVLIWDLKEGKMKQRINSPADVNNPVNQVRFGFFSKDGRKVYFGGSNKYVCEKDLNTSDNGKVIHFESKEIKCGSISPDGSKLTIGSGKMLVTIDLNTNKIHKEFNTGDCEINAVRYSADGEKLLCWCGNSRVDLRDPETLILRTSFRSGTGARKFSNLFFTNDNKFVITGDHASRFNVWDLSNHELVLDQSTEQGTIMAFDMEPSQDYLLSASLDKTIKLWKIVKVDKEKLVKKKKRRGVEEPKPEIIIIETSGLESRPVKKVEEPINIVQASDTVVELRLDTHKVLEPVKAEIVETDSVIVAEVDSVVPDQAVITDEVVKVDTIIAPEAVRTIENFDKVPERMNGRRIVSIRKEHRIVLKDRRVTIRVWDDQVVDGDIISLFVNNEEILKEFSITAKKHIVEFDATGLDKCFIILHAHNLGKIPPNTVTMTITDGIIDHRIQLRSDLTGSAAVQLKFE